MVILVSLRLEKRQRKKQSFYGRSFAGLRLLRRELDNSYAVIRLYSFRGLPHRLCVGFPQAASILNFEDPISN